MRAPRAELLAEIRRTTLLYNALVGLVGAIGVTLSLVLSDDAWFPAALALVGGALVSAALVSFVFGSITIRETTQQVDRAVAVALEDALAPVRGTLYASALENYRWDCHVDIAAGDTSHEYLDQALRIAYRVTDVPEELRFICLATTRDEVLKPYAHDPRYVFRWLIEEALDPQDESVFRVDDVLIDGELIHERQIDSPRISDARASQVVVAVPERHRTPGSHAVEFSIRARKFVGRDRRLRIQTHLFRLVSDGEFRLTVGAGLRAVRIEPSTGQIAVVGPAIRTVCSTLYPSPLSSVGGIIRVPHPMQAGSSVVFRIDRLDPTSP